MPQTMRIFYLLAFAVSPFYLFSQSLTLHIDSIESRITAIDTTAKGNVEYIDSVLGIKIVYPFHLKQVNGMVEAFYLNDEKKAFRGKSLKNKKEGKWEYYEYDSLNNPITVQTYNYEDGLLSGEFMIIDDSLWIRGNYSNDSLDGFCRRDLIMVNDSGQTIYLPLDSGLYSQDLRHGEWYFYIDGKLDEIGYFKEGLKHQNWKKYDIYYSDTAHPDTLILMAESQYFEGLKSGKEIVYYRYDIIPCEGDSSGNCFDTLKVMEYEEISWQDGKLTGIYVKKNADDVILEKGNYNNDLKMSEWIYVDPIEKKEETKNYLDDILNGPYIYKENGKTIITGTYAQEKKHQTWIYRGETGHKVREENWDKGLRSGDWSYFQSKGILGIQKVFENDTMYELHEFNNDGVEILGFKFNFDSTDYIFIQAEQLFSDSAEFKDFAYTPADGTFNDETFMNFFKEKGKDTTLFKLNGGYVNKKEGKPEVIGTYKMNIMTGNWDYFLNPSIIWRKVYDMGFMKYDLFLDKNSKAPVEKEDYVLWYGPERPRVEFKIKDGLRNGKSTYYKADGEVEKVEKYKDGIIQ